MIYGIIVFIFGLFIGSFLNVVIYRLHRQESFIKGFSKCLFCGHRLYPKDLVPLFSFVWLKGKCRYCQHHFSKQYFLVELATALGFLLIYFKFLPNGLEFASSAAIWQLWFSFSMLAFLVIIFVYDFKYYLILDSVVLPAIILAFIFNLSLGANFLNLLLAAVLASGFFLFQFIVSKGTWIGGGDIRLGFLMGAILGWTQVLTALFLAYIMGSIFSIGLLLSKKKQMSDKVPFGTFLTLATFISMLYGPALYNWYVSLFNY